MKVTVVPTSGQPLRLPDGKLIPTSGACVEETNFIRRRLRDGSLKIFNVEVK